MIFADDDRQLLLGEHHGFTRVEDKMHGHDLIMLLRRDRNETAACQRALFMLDTQNWGRAGDKTGARVTYAFFGASRRDARDEMRRGCIIDDFARILVRQSLHMAHTLGTDDWTDGPRPPETAQLHSGGSDPLRVLVFGGGPATGYGVKTHELALAGALMRQLSSITNRAVDLDVTVRADLTLERASDLLTTVTASAYEAVIVFVGVQDALDFASPTTWGQKLHHLLEQITDVPAAPDIVFVAIPPVSRVLTLPSSLRSRVDRHADTLNEAARSVMANAGTFVPFVPDEPEESRRHRSPETYERWAEQIARPIRDSLRSRRDDTEPDEDQRQAALDHLAILDTAPEDAFDRIMLLARDLFGTRAAAITFIDRDRQWFKSRAGFEATETARKDAFCDHTIRQGGPFVVCDATLDARFVDSRFVNDSNHLRFYAGYPLEGANGQRIGALCIFDTVPRSFDGRDKKLLRSLALLVQDELGRAIDSHRTRESDDQPEPGVKARHLAESPRRSPWPLRTAPA